MTSDRTYAILITDHPAPNVEIEAAVLGSVGGRLVVARSGSEAELLGLAPEADAIMTCFAQVPSSVVLAAPHLQVIGRYGGGVILLGDAGEREVNFVIRNDIDYPVLDLTGRTDVDGMAAVMQLCDAVISNDSGPMHLAVSVGTPTVGSPWVQLCG